MKKIAILVVFVLFAVAASLNAQNPALSVPKFKGIEITGTVDQFGAKLSGQGFTFLSKEDYGSVYMGRFAGISDCFVYLVPVVNSNDIASITVMIGLKPSDYEVFSYETWEDLLGNYEFLKDLLTEKYGKPTEENEGFSKEAYTANSHLRLSAVKDGQCEYFAQWGDSDIDKMVVRLDISGIKNLGREYAVITLQYRNVDKMKDYKKGVLDDL